MIELPCRRRSSPAARRAVRRHRPTASPIRRDAAYDRRAAPVRAASRRRASSPAVPAAVRDASLPSRRSASASWRASSCKSPIARRRSSGRAPCIRCSRPRSCFAGLRAARAGLLRILAAQIAGGVAHLLGDLAQLLALRALCTGRALLALARPAGLLACWPARACWPAASVFDELLGLLAQFFLIARQSFELPLHFLGAQLLLVLARGRAAASTSPSCRRASSRIAGKRILLFCCCCRCSVRRRALLLVVGLLLLAQFLIEQCRQIRLTGDCRCRRRRWPAASQPAGGEFPSRPSAIRRAPALHAAGPATP